MWLIGPLWGVTGGVDVGEINDVALVYSARSFLIFLSHKE